MEPFMAVALVVGILGKVIPLALIVGGLWFFFRSEFWKLLKHRLKEGGDQTAQIAQLAAELDEVRREMAELQERVDFSERLLAQSKDAAAVDRP